jgi:hypothetical protein
VAAAARKPAFKARRLFCKSSPAFFAGTPDAARRDAFMTKDGPSTAGGKLARRVLQVKQTGLLLHGQEVRLTGWNE